MTEFEVRLDDQSLGGSALIGHLNRSLALVSVTPHQLRGWN